MRSNAKAGERYGVPPGLHDGIAPIQNKMGAFLSDPLLNRILSGAERDLHIRQPCSRRAARSVIIAGSDPVLDGLAHPGGNLTGFYVFEPAAQSASSIHGPARAFSRLRISSRILDMANSMVWSCSSSPLDPPVAAPQTNAPMSRPAAYRAIATFPRPNLPRLRA